MSFSSVDTSDKLPLTLIKSIACNKSLVLTLAVKYPDYDILIISRQIQQVILQSLICDSFLSLNQRKIYDIILIIIPVENAVIKILYLCGGLLRSPVRSRYLRS